MKLAGTNVVITGGSQGIGEALAAEFADRGATVAVVARSIEKLERVASRIGGVAIDADLTDADAVDGLVERCLAALGHIDVWVNNAGLDTNDAFVHVDPEEIRRVARLNLEAPFMLTRAVLPHMLERNSGHIVQMSSIAGTIPFPGLAAYAGTKAGLTNFTETLRLELADTNIGFTVVAPGPVNTEMWDRLDTDVAWAQPALTRFRRMLFLPKAEVGEVALDVADAVEEGRRFVRPKRRFFFYHQLNNAPRRMVEASLFKVKLPPLEPTKSNPSGDPSD